MIIGRIEHGQGYLYVEQCDSRQCQLNKAVYFCKLKLGLQKVIALLSSATSKYCIYMSNINYAQMLVNFQPISNQFCLTTLLAEDTEMLIDTVN